MTFQSRTLSIGGMHCTGCEDVIRQTLESLPGVERADVSFAKQVGEITFDDSRIGLAELERAVIGKGYSIGEPATRFAAKARPWLLFMLLLSVVGGITFWGKSQMPALMQMMTAHLDFAALLGIGFLTGFHCIGMCGGFVVGYTDTGLPKWRQMLAHLSYGFSKTLSYTSLGAGFGLLGSAIAITPQLRGALALAASLFLLLYGLRMLNVFSALRRFVLRLPAKLNRELQEKSLRTRSPWRTGLLSGLLLGCGPLQAMYVMAAGSGDPLQGATILLLFGLGTLIPLWGFGLFATLLSANAMRQLVRVSGVLVIVMGIMMAQRGMLMLQTNVMPAMQQQSGH
ncbi:sulfite exporter TauE/SafE family protein [Methylomonas sp. HYX-M1]|uniref:urease accessory protein UreH domain-containing protein n=1 Tax=Methylomonas sp. HYX-M1 TaxID=3139307 RepID=UPI00345BFDC1